MLLDASLVQDEASQIDWVVQTAEDGTARTVVLGVPSRAEVLALWGLSGNALPSDAQGADAVAASPDAADKARVDKLVAALGALVSPARAGEPPAPTRKPGTASTSKQVVTQWADNNIGSRPSTDAVSPTLTFTLYDADGNVMHVDEDGLIISDGGTEAKDLPATPENVKKYLGMDAAPSAGTRQTAVNTYVSTADALPATVVQTTWAQDEDDNGLIYDPDTGNPVYVSTDASYRIEWSMTDMADYAGYGYLRNAASYGEGAPDTQYLQLLSEESFRIVGKVGDDTLEELGGSTSGYLYIDVVVNNEVKATYALDDLMVGGGNGQAQASIGGAFGWLPDEGSCSGTLSASLPRYTVAGEPIEYRIVYRDFVADDDYYAAAYDNSASVNHGAVVDAAYTGGTVVFTHTGTTEFAAYKQWFDGKNAALRTEVSFSLWRYSDGSTPGSVDHASQVRAADGSFITLVATPEDADENGRVDLGALLKEQYPGLALDKYDSDGYPFVYGVREDTAVANYTVEFDGTAPNYYNVAADATIGYTDQNRDPNSTADAWTRPANDHLTYNGGTVENHLSGTKQVRQMKTWSVAAFQDQLQNVRCVFTLQRRDRETGAWTPALDAEGAPVTQAIEGFNAETLTQEIAGTYPKYDDDGYEIAYRWVETDVVQEGRGADETQFERDEEANAAEFTLYLHARESSADAAEPVRFTSFMGEDGTIVNSFDNATHENVEKLWEQPDGTYARQQPDQARTDTVTVRVYQNTTLVGEFVLDGKADAEATPFDDRIQGNGGSGPAAAQETSPYYLEITGLPQYSATGAKYVYRVVESEPAGWDSDRVYDAENHLTTITNSYGPGEGTDFHLLKEWTDGDDSAHRLICYVTVRAARDLTARDGSLRYRAGEVIRADIALSEANAWFYELVVPVDGLTTDDIVIEETRLDALDGSESFEVFTRDEAVAAGLGHEDWVNAGWTNDLERVATHEHAYEVTYAAEAAGPFGEQTLTVNNRRIGLIDLTVEKEWIDGSAAPDERPAAELVLRVDDPEARFFVEGGNAYAQLAGGNKIPLYDQDGAPLDSARVEDGGMALVVPVSPDSDTSTYGFFGLPKYKGIASDGEVVHYTVEERFANQQEQGDYVISSTTGDYVIGPIHFHDTQTYHVANRRTATTEVTFYKEWNDVYVNEALQRPDIALTLYQVSKATNEKPVAVDGYIHYLWRAATDGEGGSAFGLSNPTPLDASQYLQSCTIDGLPKYDRYGDEITYYAVEEFMNDGASLGYGDVTFSASRMTGSHDPADPQLIEVASGNAANIDDSAGTAYAVRSGGTFVNSLTGTLVANGTKLWSNLPGSVQSADIPEIVVFLQRKLATDDEWPDLYVERDASGAWVPAENADGSVGAVAWTSRMEQAPGDGNRYTYSIASPGDNSNGPSARRCRRSTNTATCTSTARAR